jgi:hypothetical protein
MKASGLRRLNLMLLVPIPWSHRIWTLSFLALLCPSERYYQHYCANALPNSTPH